MSEAWTPARLAAEAAPLAAAGGWWWAARAPGRLDVMGGIADYSGSLVLELPLAAGCLAAARALAEPVVLARSAGREGEYPPFRMPLAELVAAGPGAFRSEMRWAAYVAGVAPVLAGLGAAPRGLELVVSSGLPAGAGLSSSAALEVSCLLAAAAAWDLPLRAEEVPRIAQRVEHELAGAPCGLMDQATVYHGVEGALFVLDCREGAILPPLAIPPGVALFGIETGVRHSVAGRAYARARAAAFMGLAWLGPAAPTRWLADMDPDLFRRELLPGLPELLAGAEFLRRFPGTADVATRVDPEEEYPVRAATRHPVEDRERAALFQGLLASLPAAGPDREAALHRLGDLMVAAHRSYGACGLGCGEADFLVDRVLAARAGGAGLYGGRITGGGSGGTVAVLGLAAARGAAGRIASELARETGGRVRVWTGSSPGARTLGTVPVR